MPTVPAQSLLAELRKLENLRHPDARTRRRRHPRFVIRGDAELSPMDRTRIGETPLLVMLRDAGRGGIGFVCDQPLETGTIWHLRLLQHGYGVGETPVSIRHCSQINPQVHLIGSQICLDSGLMLLLGVDPTQMRKESDPQDVMDFVAPNEV